MCNVKTHMLAELGHIKPGMKVLVTAAAGGTGQFAVQLAKLAGAHVVATAGGTNKVRAESPRAPHGIWEGLW